MMIRPRAKIRGFSLLEVLVSLAVLGISLSVIMHIFSSTALAARTGDDYYQAMQIAETRIALLMAQRYPTLQDSGSDDNGFRWKASATEYSPDFDNPLFANRVFEEEETTYIPYLYEVTVTWGDRNKRQLQLSTVRLGIKE